MRARVIALCVIAACGGQYDYVAGTQPGAPWPVIAHDEGFTSRADVTGARTGKVAWKLDTGKFIGTASPVIAADGTIYIGNSAGTLTAIRSNGSVAWKVAFGGIEGAPAIARDGSIIVASDDARLHVIAPDGTEIATSLSDDSLTSSVLLDTDGVAYFTARGQACTASRGGAISCDKFGVTTPQSAANTAFAIANHQLYVAGESITAYQTSPLDLAHGALVAQGLLGAIASDGTTFVGANGRLESHDASGAFVWACDIPSFKPSTPLPVAVVSAASVYVLGPRNVMNATPTGLAWSVDLNADVTGGIAVDSAGAAYVGASDGLHALDATGTILFTVPAGAVRSWPAIGADGTVYFGADDGALYAVGP